jgi:molybdopterin converting factor small subunit
MSSVGSRLRVVPTVLLRAPISDLAEGNRRVQIAGTTVREVLLALERAYPRVSGWVLDEHGNVRRHVNIFVNGDLADDAAPVADEDTLHVLPSITGGSDA